MCGRTACTLNPQQISSSARYRNSKGKDTKPRWKKGDEDKYRPSYNKAPQSFCPVLLHARHLENQENVEDEERVIAAMKWGLVPLWVKDLSQAQYKMNNARSDTMLTKASYKRPLEKGQRCVVLAEGFYEWNTTKTEKQPYFIYFKENDKDLKPEIKTEKTDENGNDAPNDVKPDVERENDEKGHHDEGSTKRLVTMAGIFEHRKAAAEEEEDLYTFSVITVDAHSSFAWLHHRMPAMLETDEEVRKWLDFGEVPLKEAVDLIKPKDCLTWYPVSKFVNNSRNNSPECIEKIDLTKPKPVKTSSESKGMARWLAGSPMKVKKEVTSPAKQEVMSQDMTSHFKEENEVKKEIKIEAVKPKNSPKKSPTKKGKKRPSSGSVNLMQGWLKKAKQE